jgi:AcrR family transcriptional regulator
MGKESFLTRADWIAAAMQMLRTQGVDGVRILRLARDLRVSRGSFYWHFRDRRDLLLAMLEWWDREMTDTVIRYLERLEGSGRSRILALAMMVLRQNRTNYDLAIRTWAEGDPRAATVLRRVMKKRLTYVSNLFREAGFSAAEATARGHLLAIYLMSEGTIHVGESERKRLRLLHRQVRALTEPERRRPGGQRA